MNVYPLRGAYEPTVDEYQQLLAAAMMTLKDMPKMTQALEDLRDGVSALAQAEAQQTATLEAQSTIVTALSGAVDQALVLLEQLRDDLSTEQQVLVDQAVASIAATVAGTASQSATLAAQSANLQALADRTQAAVSDTPPTP